LRFDIEISSSSSSSSSISIKDLFRSTRVVVFTVILLILHNYLLNNLTGNYVISIILNNKHVM